MASPPEIAGRMPQARPGGDAGRVLRALALIAVAIGLIAITAAACVLSYSSIHHLATAASVSPRLARLYPLIFDALLVLAGCCVLALRGAGLVSRVYSWLCLLVLLAALAGGGAVRAAAIKVPHRLAGILAAVIPWALVLIGFGLLLALLRYARVRRPGQQPAEADREAGHDAEPAGLVVIGAATAPPERAIGPASIVPGFTKAQATPGPGVPPTVTRTGGSPETPAAPQPGGPVPGGPVPGGPVPGGPVPGGPVPGGPVPAAQPAHAVARQADLQLKARVPRQPAGQQTQASPGAARHAPFMPPVGPLPAADARPGETPEAAGARAAEVPGAAAARAGEPAGAGETKPGQVPEAGPGAPGGASAGTQETNPRLLAGPPAGAETALPETALPETAPPENVIAAGEGPQNEAAANEPAASTVPPDQAAGEPGTAAGEPGTTAGTAPAGASVAATNLNAAPVIDDEAEPGAPPALRRPRSSPTPPEG